MAMSTNPFPILRLPILVLKKVLSEAGPQEIFLLSTCSQRSYRIVKSIKRPCQKWSVSFNRLWNCIKIAIKNENGDYINLFDINVLNCSEAPVDQGALITIGNFKVSMEPKETNEMNTYWDDIIFGMKETAIYFTEIFHCSIYNLVIGESKRVPEDSKWVIDWINARQKSVEELHYTTSAAREEDLTYVFLNLKVDNWMHTMLEFPDQLPRPEVKIAPMSLESVEFSEGSWMTVEHILRFDCDESFFLKTNLSNQDLNALLKHWINGGLSRLKNFRVDTVEAFDYRIVLEGVEHEEVPRNVVRQYYDYDDFRRINGGFDITRKSDGLTVTLINNGPVPSFELVLTSKLQAL